MTRTLALRRGDFWLKVGAAMAALAVGDRLFWGLGQDIWGGVIFPLPLLALVARPVLRQDWRVLVCFGLATLMALAVISDPSLLAWGLFWVFAGMGALMPGTAQFGDAWQWCQRLLWFAVRSCVAPWLDLWHLMKARCGHNRWQRHVPHLILPAMGSLAIVILFAQANPMIGIGLHDALDALLVGSAWRRLIWWPVFFTMGWSLLRPRCPQSVIATFDGSGDHELPGVTPDSVRISLITFNALFAMQNVMDLVWLWGLAPLPKGITLADYAHRGAYPLIVTSLLAAGFVLVALRPGSQTAAVPLIRRLVVLWVVQNVLLVGNAALRTCSYIAAYSLTALRISALLWMGLVALGLALVLWRVLRDKSASWLINANVAAALALLLGCSVVDLDTVATQYNIAHARELGGGGAPLDICYLYQMGPSALLPLVAIESRPAPEPIHLWVQLLRGRALDMLQTSQRVDAWTGLGAMRLAALRGKMRSLKMPGDDELPDCRDRNVHNLRVAAGLEPAPVPPSPAALSSQPSAPVPVPVPVPGPVPALTAPVKP